MLVAGSCRIQDSLVISRRRDSNIRNVPPWQYTTLPYLTELIDFSPVGSSGTHLRRWKRTHVRQSAVLSPWSPSDRPRLRPPRGSRAVNIDVVNGITTGLRYYLTYPVPMYVIVSDDRLMNGSAAGKRGVDAK